MFCIALASPNEEHHRFHTFKSVFLSFLFLFYGVSFLFLLDEFTIFFILSAFSELKFVSPSATFACPSLSTASKGNSNGLGVY